MTEPKYQELLPEADEELELDEIEELLEDYPIWRRAEFARFAYSTYNGRSQFYALGMSRELSEEETPFIAYLANNHVYNSENCLSWPAPKPRKNCCCNCGAKTASTAQKWKKKNKNE